MSYWKPIFAALIIFAAGFVTGALTLGVNRAKPAPPETAARNDPQDRGRDRSRDRHLRDLCEQLQAELELTSEQSPHVEEIVRLAHERVKTVADEMGPRIRAEFKRMEEEILKELTPEQADKFQVIIEERESRFRRGNKPAPNDQPPGQPGPAPRPKPEGSGVPPSPPD